MGTQFTLLLYRCNAADAGTIADEVFDEIDRQDQLLSNYRESSELSRINTNAAKGVITTDPEVIDFLQDALHWSAASKGEFDVTGGSS